MGYNFLPWDHDHQYLLPSDFRDWLPGDHEVWALLEAASLLGFAALVLLRSTKVGGLSGGDVGQVGVAEEPADDVGQLL